MSSITPPPGLVGEIAQAVYAMAPRPVPELAIAAAIGLMSGVCGRSYNVSGTGLNNFVLALAPTGRGKEAINSGISRIIDTIANPADGTACVPLATTFYGPSDAASGQGLARELAARDFPCFVSITGEFGHRFAQMADDRAIDANKSLRRLMLDSYNKSGHGQRLGQTVYSDKSKNIPAMISPAFSFVGESTPATFYAAIDEAAIKDGLLPRFTVIEYEGPRPPRNMNSHLPPCPKMIDRLAALMAKSITLNTTNSVVHVEFELSAQSFCDDFDRFADTRINEGGGEVVEELWNRAHVKLMKLAALIAVGINFEQPVITLPTVRWAHEQVERDIRRLIARFERGDVGEIAGDENRQQQEVLRVVSEFVKTPYEKLQSYGVERKFRDAFLVPYSYLSRRLLKLPTFSKDRLGATKALQRTLEALRDSGEIIEMPRHQAIQNYKTVARLFQLPNGKLTEHLGFPRIFDE